LTLSTIYLSLHPLSSISIQANSSLVFSYQERGYEEGFWSLIDDEGYRFENVSTYDETEQTKTWPVTITELFPK